VIVYLADFRRERVAKKVQTHTLLCASIFPQKNYKINNEAL
jgi:hypothetical protein